MQRITLEELKHILYHAFRDHLTMKDIENIIINEEESLNDTSGNCQTEFEGGRYPCFCFLPGLGWANAFTSPVWKTCWLSSGLEWPCAKAMNPGLRLKDPFGKDAIGFFFFFYIFPKLCIFAKPPLALSFLQWLCGLWPDMWFCGVCLDLVGAAQGGGKGLVRLSVNLDQFPWLIVWFGQGVCLLCVSSSMNIKIITPPSQDL